MTNAQLSFRSCIVPSLSACAAVAAPPRPFNIHARIIMPPPRKGRAKLHVSFGDVMKLTMEANGPQIRRK